jgi:hypothetical protein
MKTDSVMSNPELKKYLKDSFESIDMTTADESVLSTLSTQRDVASTAATKLESKASKRKVSEMLRSYSYGAAEGSYAAAHAIEQELIRARSEKDKAIRYPAGSKQLEKKLEEDARDRENSMIVAARYKHDNILIDARDLKFVKFFHEHCTQIDTKSAEIASKILGYSPAMKAVVIKKKPPPLTTAGVQAAIGFAFREPDCVDQAVLLANLNTQLVDTDKMTTKLKKTINTRKAKHPKLEGSHRHNDSLDRYHAHWFEQHSFSIKAKIASIGCGA